MSECLGISPFLQANRTEKNENRFSTFGVPGDIFPSLFCFVFFFIFIAISNNDIHNYILN